MSDSESKPKQYPPIGWPGRSEDAGQEVFRRIFDEFFSGSLGSRAAGTSPQWLPAVNIEESEGEFQISVALPGIRKEDIQVTLENNVLRINGERKFQGDQEKYHRIEHSYGSFSRSFTLPAPVLAERVEASLQDGILTIKVPKAGSAPERKISIY